MGRYNSNGADWVIVITKSSAEEVAERSLRQAGYRVYLPRYRRTSKPHGEGRKGELSMRPLFVGYLFVQDWHGWPRGNVINGVERLMKRPGSRPCVLSEFDIERTRRKEWHGAFDDDAPPYGKLEARDDLDVGTSVEFDLFERRHRSAIEGLTDNGKAIVTAIMFNREIRVEVDVADLDAVTA